MPLPEGYSPTEHFQDTVKRLYNRDVRDWFSDISTEELDISTPRQSLRTACTHQDEDSLLMTLGRMWLFESAIREKFSYRGVGTSDKPAHVLRRGKPKINLYFLEDLQDVEAGYAPVQGLIGFRLMDETAETLTEAKLQTLANRIRTEFAVGSGYVWRKGKLMVTYTEWEKGYQLQILCRDTAAGRNLIGKVLDIQQHTPQWEFSHVKENQSSTQAYPTIPPQDYILGELRRLPRRRPIADVRFQWATLELGAIPNPICLVDRSGTWPNVVAA